MAINKESVEFVSKYQSVVSELEKAKQEKKKLKKALDELLIEKQILKTAHEILKKKAEEQKRLRSQKKLSKS